MTKQGLNLLAMVPDFQELPGGLHLLSHDAQLIFRDEKKYPGRII